MTPADLQIDRLTLQMIVRCKNEDGAERIARKLIEHGRSLGESMPPTDLRDGPDTALGLLREFDAYASLDGGPQYAGSPFQRRVRALLADPTRRHPSEADRVHRPGRRRGDVVTEPLATENHDWKRLGVTQDGRLIMESWERSSKPLYRTLIRRENASPQWQVLVENSDYNAQRSYFNGWDGRGRYDAGDPPGVGG